MTCRIFIKTQPSLRNRVIYPLRLQIRSNSIEFVLKINEIDEEKDGGCGSRGFFPLFGYTWRASTHSERCTTTHNVVEANEWLCASGERGWPRRRQRKKEAQRRATRPSLTRSLYVVEKTGGTGIFSLYFVVLKKSAAPNCCALAKATTTIAIQTILSFIDRVCMFDVWL